MSTSPQPTSALPLVRDCRPGGLRPLLAPGGRDTYFVPDLQRLLFGANEPITRFLPPAKWTMPDRAEKTHGNACPQVAYTIPDEILKTATPLSTLPRSEIEALADAVTVFLAKARPDSKGVPPYTRQCHQEFRLPDPDLDREAYWVYGSEFDRRLLILWGTEPQAGVSLPLEKVVEKLRQREMSWRDKQNLALKLALRPDEPLSRFLAPRTQDGGFVVGGQPMPPKKAKRLKTVTPKTWREFDAAAKAFYAKAHPDAAGTAAFEKELRAEFRLPGYRQAAGDYYATSSSFVIAIDEWPRESTLPLTEDPVLKLPETAGVTATAAVPVGATVAAQLSPIAKDPIGRYIALAAAAVVVLAAIPLAIKFWPDNKPGQYVKDSVKIEKPNVIVLTFSKALDPASLKTPPSPGKPPFKFSNDDAKIRGEPALLQDGKRVVLTLERDFEDNHKYRLNLSNLRGKNGKPFEPVEDSLEIVYNDTVAPRVVDSNAGDSKKELLVMFSKSLLKDSVKGNESGFKIYPVESGKPTDRKLEIKRTDLYERDPEGKTVVVEAQDDFNEQPYSLTITGVTDRAAKPNKVDEKSAADFRFTYLDKLPPRLFSAVGEGGIFEVRLDFSKPVDPAKATDEKNYAITDAAGAALAVQKGGAKLDESGKRVTLKLDRAKLTSGQYKLVVHEITDREKRTAKDLSKGFTFVDAVAGGGPKIKAAKNDPGSPRIVATFERPPEATVAMDRSHYRILNNATLKFPVAEVQKVTQLESDKYELTLGGKLQAGEYLIETTGIADVFGNKSDTPDYARFIYKAPPEVITQILAWPADRPATYKAGVVTLTIGERIVDSSARNPGNYVFEPALTKEVADVKFDKGKTTIQLKVSGWPASGSVRVAVSGLLVADAEQYGAQKLGPIEVTPQP